MPRDDAVRHRRRAVDLVLPAHVRLHLEIDDRRGGGPAASGARVVPACGCLGRRLPACRHQVSLVRVLPEETRGCDRAEPPLNMRLAMLLCSRCCASVSAIGAGCPLCRAALSRRRTCPTRRATSSLSCSSCCSPGLPSSSCSAGSSARSPSRSIPTGSGGAWARQFSHASIAAPTTSWRWLTAATLSAARLLSAGLHHHHGPDGILGRTWPTGTMALWATLMLGAYLVLSYVGGPLR